MNFLGYQICQQTAEKISTFCLHFQLKSKWEERNNKFSKQLAHRYQKTSRPTKMNRTLLLTVDFIPMKSINKIAMVLA